MVLGEIEGTKVSVLYHYAPNTGQTMFFKELLQEWEKALGGDDDNGEQLKHSP